jgi:hypothetical protein
VAINRDPVADPDFQTAVSSTYSGGGTSGGFRGYWAMQDANFNVLGIAEADGSGGADLRERHEYTPYGERIVYFSRGSNDVPTLRLTV